LATITVGGSYCNDLLFLAKNH